MPQRISRFPARLPRGRRGPKREEFPNAVISRTRVVMHIEAAATPQSRKISRYQVALILLFVFTLPLVNPWIRGDGVGYYAFARSLLIEHKLDFTQDWLRANASFRMGRLDADGQIDPGQYTSTGHLDNHFSIGPAILWSPFLIAAHAGVLFADRFGARIPADGFSRPYTFAMALGTALYGFLAVVISFALARRFVSDFWAFIAAVGIWFGSSLPAYMYFDPSWSHAQSAFVVALFVWYWLRTRGRRSIAQWAVLGAIAGLMIDVYYVTAAVVLLPIVESLAGYWQSLRAIPRVSVAPLIAGNAVFSVVLIAVFFPTLVAKKIIYGSFFNFGYTEHWYWNSPAFFKVCFSSNHGLFTWTPILVLSILGLFALRAHDRALSAYLIGVFVLYLYVMGCYENWHGISSFGSRFFVALTPLFVIGLAALFDWVARKSTPYRARIMALGTTSALVLWNLGLLFQWGMHLIPPRGPISWRDAAYNQVAVVPRDAASAMKAYLTRRSNLMQHIERTDVKELKSQEDRSAE